MFANAQIEHFRGIRSANLEDFKRLNLFWGKNDCGKTTLLEALFLLSGCSNPRLPININTFRDFFRLSEDDLKLWFYELDEQMPIVLKTSNGDSRMLLISSVHSAPDSAADMDSDQSNPVSRLYGLKLSFSYNNESYVSTIKLAPRPDNSPEIIQDRAQGYTENLRTRLVFANYPYGRVAEILKDIIKNNEKPYILEGLQSFDSRIVDWNMVDDYVWVDIGLGALVPINIMGNGIRKLLVVLSTFYSCKNGIVFVDEIDNGVHYSKFQTIWDCVIKASMRMNVQVFATTHSLDCLRGFSSALEKHEISDSVDIGRGFVLEKTSDGILHSDSYTSYQLKYAFANDFDVR